MVTTPLTEVLAHGQYKQDRRQIQNVRALVRAGQITTSQYVVRHMALLVGTANFANLAVLAARDTAGSGRVKMTNAEIAAARGKAERTVREQTGPLARDGRFVARSGWTWVFVGYREHDLQRCPHPDCMLDALALGDELARRREARSA